MNNFFMTLPPLAKVFPAASHLHCLFCGGKDHRICDIVHHFYIACPECGAHGPLADTVADAVTRYLKRSDPRPNPTRCYTCLDHGYVDWSHVAIDPCPDCNPDAA